MKTILTLDPATIDPDPKGRIGLFFPAKAAALGLLMKQKGQNDPIKVVKLATKSTKHDYGKVTTNYAWRAVTGRHRLEGCLREGLQIQAIEVAGTAAELLGIQKSENLDRRDLEPLEHSMFVRVVADEAKNAVLEKHGVASLDALGGLSRANRVQFSEMEKADEFADVTVDNLSTAFGWKEETAKALGLDPKSLQRALRIHRLIVEPFHDLIDVFKDHPVAKVRDSLLKICAIADEPTRRKVVECLCAGPTDLGYAFAHCGLSPEKAEPEPYRKFSGQIMGGWSRLNTAQQRRFIPEFVSQLTPAQRSFLRDELNQKEDGQ
jgi:ParB family transcriptional regulator, chromosome partitioning protein